jgi:hypothetical protein
MALDWLENTIREPNTALRHRLRYLMRSTLGLSLSAGILLGITCATPRIPAITVGIACSDLARASWSGFTIDSSEELAYSSNTPAHCRVRGTIDTEIHFELLLPRPEAWNSRFVMGGGGGFVGAVQNQALQYAPDMLAEGFATVGTDTGHEGSQIDATWALDRPDREVNFGHRAVHVTADAAKTIMRLHYGRDIDYSYWLGCSRGGGQGMVESQRYPDDFNGIVVGAPAYDWPALGAQFIKIAQAMYPEGPDAGPVVTPEARALLAAALLESCDGVDGLEDGLIEDPRDCDFRAADLPRCTTSAGGADCVTDAQLKGLEAVYGDVSIDGEELHPGFNFGGEVDSGGWDTWVTGAPNSFGPGTPSLQFAFGTQLYKYLIFDDPEWDYLSYDFSGWAADTERAAELLNATDTDLTAFKVAGGKIIYWTGWSDLALTPLGTIEYFEGVQQDTKGAEDFTRLFMLPGVVHCAGGPGPDGVDWLTAIQEWVEKGVAPDRLVATKGGPDEEAEMTRAICAYPARARYVGSGDARNEDKFECVLSERR